MLSEAIDQILKEEADARASHERKGAQRWRMRTLDRWLYTVEELLERDADIVPEPLFHEIGVFLHAQAPLLYRELRRNRRRDAAAVLDVLFQAQGVLRHASRAR